MSLVDSVPCVPFADPVLAFNHVNFYVRCPSLERHVFHFPKGKIPRFSPIVISEILLYVFLRNTMSGSAEISRVGLPTTLTDKPCICLLNFRRNLTSLIILMKNITF